MKDSTKHINESVYLPMHWDAQDPLHGGEDLGYFFFGPVCSMLRDDDGLVDI